ncbi:MAG TPA: ABC transporter permease [Baekduia sp.]|uniref:ABC transporter permease n=1 Tax=Baekduia sp. TaxID=2600305 RepID=UPI002D789C87|nr:ABC transporter permease [Baekduia sp.]HET6507606.1 ABC transporter permease [Baekduia sp.]
MSTIASTAPPAPRARGAARATRRSPWLGWIGRRLVQLALGVVFVATAAFFILRLLPGDPARTIAGVDARPETVAHLRASLGLDRSLPAQYVSYLGDVARLDFGQSFSSHRDVTALIGDRLLGTLLLAGLACAVMLVVGVAVGMVAGAATEGGRRPRVEMAFGFGNGLLASLPEFVTGVFLVYVFGVTLGWLPIAGRGGPDSWVLPVLALAIAPTAALARIVRLETVRVLATDYVRAARGHRLPARLLYLRHALPNLLTSALTIGGLLFAGLLGSTVVVENVFAWPGLGTLVVEAIETRDYPVIEGAVFVLGVMVLVINTLVDAALAWLDPRLLTETA